MIQLLKILNALLINRLIVFSVIFLTNQTTVYGQKINTENSFDKELLRLNTNIAQVFGRDISQAPNWSNYSDTLFCQKESNEIFSINLRNAALTVGVWHNDTIGVIRTDLIKQLESKDIERYKLKYQIDHSYKDSIQTKSETIIKFVPRGLSTIFIIQEKNEKERVQWVSGSVCGGIVISPNEKYIAFYCETSGVFIMKIE